MSINFLIKTAKFPGALKAYTEKHLLDIEKIAGDIIDAEVTVNEEKFNYKVVISLKTRLNSFYAEETNRILKQAVRDALGTIKSQTKRNKEKLKEEKKRVGKGFFKHQGATVFPEKPEPGEDSGRERILISNNFSRKPITVEEAIFYLRESRDNGFMFVNSETNRIAGVFLNSPGQICLIEPEG